MFNFVDKKNYLSRDVDLFFCQSSFTLMLKGSSKVLIVYLPSFYFFKKDLFGNFEFLFLKNFFFKSFLKHLLTFYNTLFVSFFLKIKLRGLGYRVRSLARSVHIFFFNYTNYYFFFCPEDIIVKLYRKRILLLSFDWSLLKLVVSHILLFKKLGPYRLRGLRLVRQIIILKKAGKLL